MKRIFLLLSLLLVAGYYAVSQSYLAECISFPGKDLQDIKVNALHEMCLAGGTDGNPDRLIMKLDKNGNKLWENHIQANYISFYHIDDAGIVYALVEDNPGEYRFFRFLSDGTPVAPVPLSLPSTRIVQMKMDGAGNIYFAWATGDPFFWRLEATTLTKYNANGVFQWSTPFSYTTSVFSNTDIIANSSGEVFVTYRTEDPYTILLFDLHMAKLDSDGDLLSDVILETRLYTDDDVAFDKQALYLHPTGQVILINEKDPSNSSSDDYSEVYIVHNASLNVTRHHTVPFAEIKVSTGGRSVYLAGITNYYYQNIIAGRIAEDLSYTQVTDSLHLPSFPSRLSLLVDPSESLSVIGSYPRSTSSRIYISHYNTSGTFTGQYAYFGAGFAEPGPTIFDFENNLLTPLRSCLMKMTPCSKVPLTITNQPVNTDVCPGTDAKFQVNVNGRELGFYWYKNNNRIVTSTKFEGAETGTLTVKQVSPDDAGTYYCEIKDACGRVVKTQNAVLTVPATATITTSPDNLIRCVGTEAIFQITATGGKNLKYQWKKGNVNLVESGLLVGTKTNKLTVKAAAATDAGDYYCEVTTDCSSTTLVSQKASLSIQLPTAIIKNPEILTSCTGGSVVLSVTATGTNLTYQWKKGTNNLVEGSRYVGTKSSTLTLSQLQTSDAGEYTCVVTGACGGSLTSSKGVLTVTIDQQITSQPQSQDVCAGTNVTFGISTSGSGVTYQWVKGNTNLSNNTKIAGATTNLLTIKNTSASDEGSYTCIIITACGNKQISEVAQLHIGTTTVITAKSPDQNLCSGELAKFSITTNVTGINFQWKKNGIPLTDGPNVTGSGTRELFVNDITISDAGSYTCQATSVCGPSQASGAIQLVVKEKAALTGQPASQTLCEESDMVLSVTATGTSLQYQWKYGGEILTNSTTISGATSPTLTVKSMYPFREGFYTCEVKGCNGVVASKAAFIKVNPKPKLVLQDHIACDNPYPEWTSLVKDENNTYGEYLLFKGNATEPLQGLSSIVETGTYFIVKQTETCSDRIEWNNVCLITATEADRGHDITVYPNPTARWIYIQYDPSQWSEFELFDSQGRKAAGGLLESTGKTLLDGTLFPGGVYSIRLKSDEGKTIFQRLIVKR